MLLLGVALICFSQIKNFPFAMFFGVCIGFGSIAQYTVSNIVIQSESDPKMRGRAIGILFMAIGMLPLGSLLVGAVSTRIGAPTTVLCEGIAALVVLAVFYRRMSGKGAVATGDGAGPTKLDVAEAQEEVENSLT
jgi:MFS family permease